MEVESKTHSYNILVGTKFARSVQTVIQPAYGTTPVGTKRRGEKLRWLSASSLSASDEAKSRQIKFGASIAALLASDFHD